MKKYGLVILGFSLALFFLMPGLSTAMTPAPSNSDKSIAGFSMLFFFIAITVLFIYQKQDQIRGFFDTPPDFTSAHDFDVVLYATSWCGYCAKTRTLLENNDIPYVEYDVESSSEGYRQYVDLGGRGVPLLQINGKVVKGYMPSRILELASSP